MKVFTLAILLLTCTETLSLIISPLGAVKKALNLVRKKTTSTPGLWGTWAAWSEHCSVTCGIGFRRRTRTCSYTGKDKKQRCKAINMKAVTLAILILTYTETLALIISPLGAVKKALNLVRKKTTSTPGLWGTWADWTEHCSVTCGIGFRRRTRTCSYTGKDKKRRCKGHKGEMKNCDTKLTCPVDGGWTSWVAWDCSVSCGGGVGMQKRSCTNPKPMFGGKKCEGPGEEDGKCNVQKCADEIYTLSPGVSQDLKDAVEKINYSFEKREGSNVDLPCNPTLVANIYKEYPSSILFWAKNGKVLKIVKERMQISLTELSIVELGADDNGVYLCSMRYAPDVVKPLTIVTVAVTPKKANVQVPLNENFALFCNGHQLGKIYKSSSKAWLLNGVVFKEFTNGTSKESNVFEIKKVVKNMTGTWTCQITDSERGFVWTTNITKVKVLPPISTYLKLLKNRQFLFMVGTAVIVIVLTVGTCLAYKITRAREEFMEEFELWCLISEQYDDNDEFEDDSEGEEISPEDEESMLFN